MGREGPEEEEEDELPTKPRRTPGCAGHCRTRAHQGGKGEHGPAQPQQRKQPMASHPPLSEN